MTTAPVFPRASLVLVGAAWVLPFLQPYHRYPITAFYSEWLALALGLAAAFLLLRKDSWRMADVPAVMLAPFGLILVLGAQVALDRVPYAEQALVATFYLLWAVVLIALGRVLRRELGLPAVADVLAWFLLAGGLLNALAGLCQLYEVPPLLVSLVAERDPPTIYGNLQQRNHFAAYMAMGVASAGYLHGRGKLRGILAGICLALFALVMAMSGSRSPWLYLGAFAALAALHHRARRDGPSRRLVVYALWLLPAFAVAQWAPDVLRLPEEGVTTSARRLFETASGIDARLQLAGEGWQMFAGSPWIGAGWGQFAWQHFLHVSSTGPGILPGICNHAHNIMVQLLAETGIIGGALLLGAVVLWLADLRQARFDLEWWWLLALVAVLGLHSLLEYPLWYAYFLGPAAVLAGLGAQRVIPVRRAGAARALVALLVLSGVLNLAAVLGPYREFERLVFDPQRSAALSMTDATFADAIAGVRNEPLLAPYVDLVVAHGIEVTSDRLPEKLELTTRAMHFAPANVVVFRQAMLLALAGESAAAARQLDRAARAYPRELENAIPQLAGLARSRPVEFTPLLELAAARRAQPRGGGALEDEARRR